MATSSPATGSMGTGTARSGEELSSSSGTSAGREAARGGERRDEARRAPGAGRREIGRAATGVMPRRGGAGDVGKASGVDGGAAATITGARAGWRKRGGGVVSI